MTSSQVASHARPRPPNADVGQTLRCARTSTSERIRFHLLSSLKLHPTIPRALLVRCCLLRLLPACNFMFPCFDLHKRQIRDAGLTQPGKSNLIHTKRRGERKKTRHCRRGRSGQMFVDHALPLFQIFSFNQSINQSIYFQDRHVSFTLLFFESVRFQNQLCFVQVDC